MTTTGRATYALVSENGWVHAVHNHLDIAEREAEKRSVAPEDVDQQAGKHVYRVVRYVPEITAYAASAREVARRLVTVELTYDYGHTANNIELIAQALADAEQRGRREDRLLAAAREQLEYRRLVSALEFLAKYQDNRRGQYIIAAGYPDEVMATATELGWQPDPTESETDHG